LPRVDWDFDVFRPHCPVPIGVLMFFGRIVPGPIRFYRQLPDYDMQKIETNFQDCFFIFSVNNANAKQTAMLPARHTISANGLINSEVIVNSNMIFDFMVFPYS